MLLDKLPDQELAGRVAASVESDGDSRIADLHVWQVAPGRMAAIVSVVNHTGATTDAYRARLKQFGFAHLSIEVNTCETGEDAPKPL